MRERESCRKNVKSLRPFRAVWGHCAATDGLLARSPHLELDTLFPALADLGYRGVGDVFVSRSRDRTR